MEKSQYNKYLKRFAFITTPLLLVVMIFNWFIDPYGIYDSPRIEGINMLKPQLTTHLTLAKAHSVRNLKPQAIILGSSRALWGIDANHPGWSYAPVYNLALPAVSTYEMLRYFQHANSIKPLKQVILLLDFFVFNVNWKETSDFSEARLVVSYDGHRNVYSSMVDTLPALLSFDALLSSKKTITDQANPQFFVLENGTAEWRYLTKAYRDQFTSVYKGFFNNWVSPDSTKKYQLEDPETGRSAFDYYRQILQIAYQDDIDLRIATSPTHALLWEVIDTVGLWPEYEQWKRMITQISEEEAQRAGKPPFPLWDFSIYNEFTTETVPPLGDNETQMQWYWEASHYKKELGDLVLNRVFDYQKDGQYITDNLGVLITSKNIDEHLRKIRDDRELYRHTHPDDIAEIIREFDLYLRGAGAEAR